VSVEKVVQDGHVAVLYSPGYGGGWSTWANSEWAETKLYCPELVKAIEDRDADGEELARLANLIFPDQFNGGAEQLMVAWLPQGTAFKVVEYDGYERIEQMGQIDWFIA
jgi:hypothetical protein